MSFTTFSGPIRSGTQRYNPGRNTGLALLGQVTPVVFGTLTGTACVVPAGSIITRITFQTTTAFSGVTTLKLTIGSTDITVATTVTNVSVTTISFSSSTAALALLSNVGTTDATLTYTLAGAGLTTGAGNIIVEYIQRGPDGAQAPTEYQN